MIDYEIIDNFLLTEECDFLINYFNEYYHNFNEIYESSQLIPLRGTPVYHLRKNLIRRKIINFVLTNYPLLKFNFDQLVKRQLGVYTKMHRDRDHDPFKIDWTLVCYLNDDFEGGETLLRTLPGVESITINPIKGRAALFNSKKLLHGTSIPSNNRYTYIAWWQEN